MKKLLAFLAITALIACGSSDAKVKEKTLIYSNGWFSVHQLTVDSVDYLIARSGDGISIIKK